MEASGERSSSEDETSNDEVDEGAEEDWVDELDEDTDKSSAGAPKWKQKKILMSVDKVHALSIIVFVFDQTGLIYWIAPRGSFKDDAWGRRPT